MTPESPVTESEIAQRVERDRLARSDGWRLMVEAVRPQRWWILVGVLSGFIWTLARLAVPQLAARAVDDGIRGNDLHLVFLLTLAMLAVGVIQALTTGLRRFCAFRIALRTETDLRTRLFAHLQRLHFAFHDEAQTGQLMARANSDLQQINTVVILLPLTAASMLTMIGVLVIMMMKSVVLAMLALGLLPLLNRAATRFSTRITPANLALQEELSALSGVVEESLSGIRIVKGFGAESMQVKRLDNAAEGVQKQALRAAKLRSGFMPLIDLLPTLSLVAIIWYGGHLVLDGQLQIGDTLTEGEQLGFKGIPYFAPEMFRIGRPRDPFKAKHLQKGLKELGEEGAIQVFDPGSGNTLLLGAVGQLQFEVVAQRLQSEYNVDAVYDNANIHTARWLTFPDDTVRKNFEKELAINMARDVDDNPVYLAPNKYNLQLAMERWPQVGFHDTREHGQQLAHS